MNALKPWGATFKADKSGLYLTIHNMVLLRLWVYCNQLQSLFLAAVADVRRDVCGDR